MRYEPTEAAERGAPVSHRGSDGPVRSRTRWTLASSLADDEPLAAHLDALLDVLEPRAAEVRALIGEGCRADWFCFLEARPSGNLVSIEPPTLTRLASLGAELVLDIYDSDPDDVP
jgi:hypothetical protein